MISSPAEINIATKLSKLEQRAIDVLIEREIFNRFILAGETPKAQNTFDYRTPVSFVEQVAFELHRDSYTVHKPRMVPFYTRAKEPVVHILLPEIAKQELCTQVVDGGTWTSVHVVARSNNLSPISDAVHSDYAVAVSVACLKAMVRNPAELALKFQQTMTFINR